MLMGAGKRGMEMEKINYKRINTENLLKIFCAYKDDNISIEDGGLRFGNTSIYESGRVLVEDSNLEIRDIAVDDCNLIYLISRNKILTYDIDTKAVNEMGCKPFAYLFKGDEIPVNDNAKQNIYDSQSGIGIDKDTIYIAWNQQIIALAKSNFQIRWILGEALNDIKDLTTGNNGIIYVIKGSGDKLLRINRNGHIVKEQVPGSEELCQPTDIAVDRDGDVYVLDGNDVYIFKTDGTYNKISTGSQAKGLAVDPKKQIFIGEPGNDTSDKTIYKIYPGNQKTPLWSYMGSTGRLICDSKGNLCIINYEGTKLAFLQYRDKDVYMPNNKQKYSGIYISKPIDSQKPRTRWHRFLLEGEFKIGTKVEFSYYISDTLLEDDIIKNKSDEQWHKGLPDSSASQGEEKRDALFQENIEGQYLWFKLSLIGSETVSIKVMSITIFFPRTSYLDYLPAIYQGGTSYQDDLLNSIFLERFLSIFESVLSEIDFNIEHINRFFDSLGAPPEFLSWLGSWLAVSMDESWAQDKKRLFIQNAISLYKKRGTREGLEESITLFTGVKPSIVESFSIGRQILSKECKLSPDSKLLFFPPDEATTAIRNNKKVKLSDVLFGQEPFCFCVFLANANLDENSTNTVRRIIEEQKPAHTCYGLKVLEPWFYLDMHTYLGVNTTLTYQAFILDRTSVIGRDTVLYDTEQSGQVRIHSRTGVDTNLT
jgi:phage tail-like protein